MAGLAKAGRRSSYGTNLRLLQGISALEELQHVESVTDQNKWLFEVAWEVANKGKSASYRAVLSRLTYHLFTNLEVSESAENCSVAY